VAALFGVFGMFGMGVGLGWWGPGAGERDEIADAGPPIDAGQGTEAAKVEVEPVKVESPGPEPVKAEPHPAPPPDPGPAGTTGAEPITADSQDAIDPDPPAPRERNRPEPAADPAEVEFLVGEFNFVFIKVAGRELALEPKAKLELKPGRHKVYLRKTESDEWEAAGTIKIDAGKRYKARMTKPAGVKLEVIG
jgi:hypothetical protein